ELTRSCLATRSPQRPDERAAAPVERAERLVLGPLENRNQAHHSAVVDDFDAVARLPAVFGAQLRRNHDPAFLRHRHDGHGGTSLYFRGKKYNMQAGPEPSGRSGVPFRTGRDSWS